MNRFVITLCLVLSMLMLQIFCGQGFARVMAEMRKSTGTVEQVFSNGSVKLSDRIYEPASERVKKTVTNLKRGQQVTIEFYDIHGKHLFTNIFAKNKVLKTNSKEQAGQVGFK